MNSDKIQVLQDNYLGFLILRPISNHIIGRSVISPKALKYSDFLCSLVSYTINVHGIPLACSGFPHASQTAETISCAETSLWSIIEYFGYRYSENQPILPSEIIKELDQSSIKSLVPSEGLTIPQISQSLKHFGFSTKIYYSKNSGNDFSRILYTYIESGIPVILGLTNDSLGHAVVCIGHKKVSYNKISFRNSSFKIKNKIIFESSDFHNDFIVVDDNYPPYQIANFENPCKYYLDKRFHSLKIEYFVVPLYKRVYLEAVKVAKLIKLILEDEVLGLQDLTESEYVLRYFLTSQRSFKKRLHYNKKMSGEMRDYLLNLRFPKFIWVAELSNKMQYVNKEAEALFIIDATGDDSIDSICFLSYPGKRVEKDENSSYTFKKHSWTEFESYQNNLKGEWCLWNS